MLIVNSKYEIITTVYLFFFLLIVSTIKRTRNYNISMFIFQSADNNKQLGNITTVSIFLNHFSVISNRENITVCLYFNYFSVISNPGNIGSISAAPQSTQTPPNPPQSALSATENSHRSNASFNAIKMQIPTCNWKNRN